MTKIRTGFVSNSSSSSFMIYGAAVEHMDHKRIYEMLSKNMNPKQLEELDRYTDKTDDEYYIDDLSEFLYDIGPDEYDVHFIEYSDATCYIGKCPTSQPNDMTHGDWKNGIDKDLTELFGEENVHLGWHEDCSYGG